MPVNSHNLLVSSDLGIITQDKTEANNIYITQPTLPPLEEFIKYLEDIWESKKLTNKGKYHELFEKELANFLGVKYVSLFANGTFALVTALQTLRITGEVITTPYSFVATTHALHWNGITPVFADIEPEYCNLDPRKIEAAITSKTTAILPVHVYGNPCDSQKIQDIADNYGLKVIYDACHAFNVRLNGNSILNNGDLSILSFHATKVFNTFEGGAIICHDEKTKKRIDFLKNFGFADEVTVVAAGINAKMNEFQASLGLLQLQYIDQALARRKEIAEIYKSELAGVAGLRMLHNIKDVTHNYSYFPIFVNKETFGTGRDTIYNNLKKDNIFSRRYFYPLISQFPMYKDHESAVKGNLKEAEKISEEVLCLPIYPGLETADILRIIKIIHNSKESC